MAHFPDFQIAKPFQDVSYQKNNSLLEVFHVYNFHKTLTQAVEMAHMAIKDTLDTWDTLDDPMIVWALCVLHPGSCHPLTFPAYFCNI